MALYEVPVYDSDLGNRKFYILISDYLVNANNIRYSHMYYERHGDSEPATIDLLTELSEILQTSEWRDILFYYPNYQDIPYINKMKAKVFSLFRNSRSGYYANESVVQRFDTSGDLTINGTDTLLRDYGAYHVTADVHSGTKVTGSVYENAALTSYKFYPHTAYSFASVRENEIDPNNNRSYYTVSCGQEFMVLGTDSIVDDDYYITDNSKYAFVHITCLFSYYTDDDSFRSVSVSITHHSGTLGTTTWSQLGNIDRMADIYNDTEPIPSTIDTDPYIDEGGEPSGEDGGRDSDGQDNWEIDAGDNTPVPNLPTLSVADTGFITLYNPNATQLKNLANYMWGNLFDISTWKKVLADPMDAIIGLSLVPVNVPSGGSQTVTVGNISTGISLTKASTQFVEVDCGSVKIDEIWKAYLDYSPYTKISIYLPYIGSQELDIDLYQNTTVGVKYHIDILSGACVAYVTVNGNVICQFSGQCAVSIPITSQDFTQTITTLATLVASGVGVVATGGMSAPVQGAAIAGLATAAANTAANVISSKPIYAKTGNMAGSNGLMGVQTPYLIIEHARQCTPAYQNRFTGYPSYITKTLSSVSGFTQIQDIRLDNIGCTSEERNEILQLLRNGVIL